MTLDEQFFIDRIQGAKPIGDVARTDAPKGDVESSEFRAILEKLEQLARTDETKASSPDASAAIDAAADPNGPQGRAATSAGAEGTNDDLDALHADLRRADDEYLAAMDLRRKLEQAYRSIQP